MLLRPSLLLLLLSQEEHAKEFIKERFETKLLELKVGSLTQHSTAQHSTAQEERGVQH
jgi:hypothetical protein